MQRVLGFLRETVRIIQLTLPRAAVGWMFAILTSNFNRIAIHELGIAAIVVTSMIGLYHFLSPFQVYFGRFADQNPIFGYRRTPYLLLGVLIASSTFSFLTPVALSMSEGNLLGYVAGFALLVIFGIGFAISGSSHLSLIADVTTQRNRGMVITFVWIVLIMSSIISLGYIRNAMPVFDPEVMQSLYSRTLPIVMILTIVGLIGVEPRHSKERMEEIVAEAKAAIPSANVFKTVRSLTKNNTTRSFFLFVFVSTVGVFMQDTILEPFGAEVMGLTVDQTGQFQQMWGVGVLGGMFLMGLVTAFVNLSKKKITIVGCYGSAASMMLIVYAAVTANASFMTAALVILGFFVGLYTLGALSVMMDLTTEAMRATYMGLWGLSQALGSGMSSILAGALVTVFVETGLFAAPIGYATIFFLEALMLVWAAFALRPVDVKEFHGLSHSDMARMMEAEALA